MGINPFNCRRQRATAQEAKIDRIVATVYTLTRNGIDIVEESQKGSNGCSGRRKPGTDVHRLLFESMPLAS